MPVHSDRPAEPLAGPRPAGPRDPRWRVLLESRWRARLLEVTELSVAYHDAAAVPVGSGPGDGAQGGGRQLRRLLNRAVAARRALADTEEALVRLAAGRFGRCEHCAAPIAAAQLATEPEARYCPRCTPAEAWLPPQLPSADRL
jgi:RNA polymerase-binding transcription factor DksA